jgi:glucose-1-phosphate adenylyltransferase
LNLYNRNWPVRTAGYSDPPAKFTFDEDGRRGEALDTILAGGCIVAGGTIRRSVIGRWVRVDARALVEDCVVFDGCEIGEGARIRRAILEKNVVVPPGTVIGYDRERDRQRYQVTESGLVILAGRRSTVGITSVSV